jgi:predicted ester cyclase
MSTKDPKALIHHLMNEFNKGKAATMAVIDEIFAPNVVLHAADGTDIRGLTEHKQMFEQMFKAIPDLHITLNDMIVEGDKVAIRFTYNGTHKGEYMGIPPTNKKVTISMIEIDRIIGGKIVEAWARADTLGFMQQLGVIPTSKK